MSSELFQDNYKNQREVLLQEYLSNKSTRHDVYDSAWKDFFIPHEGNNHHPHFLHTKRAILYGSLLVVVKAIVVGFILAMPIQAFLSPDILAEQEKELNILIQDFRAQQQLVRLENNSQLELSSLKRAEDMVSAGYFSHHGPNGHDLAYFLKQQDYKYQVAGENLAMGFASAQSVMRAWLESPLHRKNLADPDFSEMGLGIAEGQYQDKYTTFIANHFGQPLQVTKAAEKKPPTNFLPPSNETAAKVLGQSEIASPSLPVSNEIAEKVALPVSKQADELIYHKENSNIFWRYNGKETVFSAKAVISGPVKSVMINVGTHQFPLTLNLQESSAYTGQLSVAEPIDNFFRVVINPTITIDGDTGVSLIDSLPWYNVKVVEQGGWEKYITARQSLPGMIAWLFSFSTVFYIFAVLLLCLALLLNIFIKMHKQHPHVVAQTFLLIILASLLMVV